MVFDDSNKNLFELPFLTHIGLVVTYKCQISCPHCIIKAGPDRKEVMRISDSLNWLQQIADYRNGRIKIVSLTGGEPFYNIAYLREISDYAVTLGLIVSAVTNAFWATSKERAIEILKGLGSIKWLTISTDSYHQRSIPFEKVKNAIAAAEECAIPYSVSVCTENRKDEQYLKITGELYNIIDKEKVQTVLTFQAGRAQNNTDPSNYILSDDPPLSACAAAKTPIILPNGNILACIGPILDLNYNHPLVLGNLNEDKLEDILDRSELNSVLHAIRVWGPRKLISLLKEAGLGKYLPDQYVNDSICNACYHLFSKKEIVDFLIELKEDTAFKEKVAYARVHYLKESQMIEALLKLQTTELKL